MMRRRDGGMILPLGRAPSGEIKLAGRAKICWSKKLDDLRLFLSFSLDVGTTLFLLGARAAEDVPHRVIALVARVLVDLLVVVDGERHPERPRSGPGFRIIDGDRPKDLVRGRTREPFDELQRLGV